MGAVNAMKPAGVTLSDRHVPDVIPDTFQGECDYRVAERPEAERRTAGARRT